MQYMNIDATTMYNISSRILMASDTEIIVGSVDPEFISEGSPTEKADTEIHREDALPPGEHNAVIKVGNKVVTDNNDDNKVGMYIAKLMDNADLSGYDTDMRVAKVRNKAISVYCDCLAKHARQFSNFQPGMEHWFFNGVFNVLSHFTGILTTYVTRGFADFKRSELTEYVQSNRFSVYQIFRNRGSIIGNVRLPLPKELKCNNLHDVYHDIQPFLNQARMQDRLGTLSGIIQETIDNEGRVPNIPQTQNSDVMHAAKRAISRLAKNTKTADTFSSIYGNPKALETTVDELRDADSYLYTVSSLHSSVQSLDALLNTLSRKKIVPESVNTLATTLKFFADLLSNYGDTLSILNILQHHAVLHLDILRNELNA